jgi:hypothetical protein
MAVAMRSRQIIYERCCHWDCQKDGDHWIGEDENGYDSYVCEEHLQHCELTDIGWKLHRSLKNARKAQAKEKWEWA